MTQISKKNVLNDLLGLTHCLWGLKRAIEDILVDYHDISAIHRIDIERNTELMFKITSKDSEAFNSQNQTLPIHLKKDILVELNMMHNWGIITVLLFPFTQIHFCANPIQLQNCGYLWNSGKSIF